MDAELKEMFGIIIGKLDSLDDKVGGLDKKVTMNSIDIESIKSDLKTIVEVQKANVDKNERDHAEIVTLINQKMGLHSAILKNISSDLRGLEEDQKILEREVLSIKLKIG